MLCDCNLFVFFGAMIGCVWFLASLIPDRTNTSASKLVVLLALLLDGILEVDTSKHAGQQNLRKMKNQKI